MEVASPIPFPYSQGGTKRRFACSPMIDTTIGVEPTEEFSMADDSTSCHHAFKRRRRLSGDIVDCTSSSGGGLAFPAFSPPVFASYGTPQTKSCGKNLESFGLVHCEGRRVCLLFCCTVPTSSRCLLCCLF